MTEYIIESLANLTLSVRVLMCVTDSGVWLVCLT